MATFRDVTRMSARGAIRQVLSQGVGSSFRRCRSIAMCVGLLLLGAATLKLHQLLTGPYLFGGGGVDSRGIAIAFTTVEIFLGCMLVTGLCGPQVRWATVALFCCFLGVSLVKALSGAQSCGCFGRIPVSPWWAAIVDMAVLSALVWPDPTAWGQRTHPRRATASRLAAACVLPMIAVVAALGSPPSWSERSDGIKFYRDGRVALLLPEQWVGKHCPLLPHIVGGNEIARGRWEVVLYHHNCRACQELMEQLANRDDGDASVARVAWIELPPYGSLAPPAGHLKCRLPAECEWVVETPARLMLDDAMVTGASLGPITEDAS